MHRDDRMTVANVSSATARRLRGQFSYSIPFNSDVDNGAGRSQVLSRAI